LAADRDFLLGPINAGADGRRRNGFAVHVLNLDLFGRRIRKFVIKPERRFFLSSRGHFLGEVFAVDVLRFHHILADQLRIGGMRERYAVEALHDRVDVAVHVRRAFVDLSVGFFRAFGAAANASVVATKSATAAAVIVLIFMFRTSLVFGWNALRR
jgi:hypothetical protein